ncbi:MAG: ATP-binding protein [Syntrophomonadaceae bacterium]|nr:ATP-binding protein [Syntrophomonadaceae bacterium]
MVLNEVVMTREEFERLDRLRLAGQMAAFMAHEVRNPIATVRGYLQLLQADPECASAHERFAVMIEELDRADGALTEYLRGAREQGGRFEPVAVNSIIEKLYPMLSAAARGDQKLVTLDLRETPMINADPGQMRQLLLNLIRNGLEAMPCGGAVTVGTFSKNDRVALWVKDEGPGIPPKILELARTGQPLVSTKQAGTGLGLAICYGIAHRHHAVIEVDTGAGGTVFKVWFDRVQAP